MTRPEPVIAHISVDTLYVSIDGELQHGIGDVLRLFREQAEDEGAAVDSPWEFEGSQVMLRHHGWFSYGYWLTCEAFDCMVSTAPSLPVVFVQLRQVYLYEVGDALEAYRRVLDWLTTNILAKVERQTVSRLDLCADLIGLSDDDLDPRRFTTRARDWHMRGRSADITGLEWGVRGNPVYCRFYDKTLEAVVHRKTWMDQLWLPAGWDPGEREPVHDKITGEVKRNKDGSIRTRWKRKPERVMRLEFELRGSFLDRFAEEGREHLAVKDPETVLRNAGHLWQYLTGRWLPGSKGERTTYVGWLVLRRPTQDPNKSRWPPPPWWEKLASEGLRQARMTKLVRRRQDMIDADALLRQAAGCIAQRAAILGDTTLIEAAQDFAREWARLLEEKGTTFRQVVDYKAKRRGLRRTPLEKAAYTAAPRDQVEGGNARVERDGVLAAVER